MGGVEATAKDMPSPTRAVDAARRADGAAADASFTSHDASLSSPLSVGGAVFHAPMEHAGLSFSPSPTRVNAAADGTPADDTPARERECGVAEERAAIESRRRELLAELAVLDAKLRRLDAPRA